MIGTRELFLLSPYRLPTHTTVSLSDVEVLAFLAGYSALWHPAALAGAAGPPRIVSPFEHEQPAAGCVYAIPEAPPLYLPEDWEQRLAEVGAVGFRAVADREATLGNLCLALQRLPGNGATVGLAREQVAPFLGIGFGYLQLEALLEAMGHENVLGAGTFWESVRQAATLVRQGTGDEAWRQPLSAAARQLLAAREVAYPVTIHLLDLAVLASDGPSTFLPKSLEYGLACNVVASAEPLERLARDDPGRLDLLRTRLGSGEAEVCGGCYRDRADELLSVESALWNLCTGLEAIQRLTGAAVRVFAKADGNSSPRLPEYLEAVGLRRVLAVILDGTDASPTPATAVRWATALGGQVEAFTRPPHSADSPHTCFHLAYHLHQTIMHDHAATLALVHTDGRALSWYDDWLELSRLAPVLGRWTTLSRYFDDVAPEEAAVPPLDDSHADFLSARVEAGADAVSALARHARLRREIDTAWTLASFYRSVVGCADSLDMGPRLAELERGVELGQDVETELAAVRKELAGSLGERLLARAPGQDPGYLVLNPCGFARRMALELEGSGGLAAAGSVKAWQQDGSRVRALVEVPALGFAWIPRDGSRAAAPAPRMRLAEGLRVRNEFFEAEVDPVTGGLRGIWDHRTTTSRLGQQLVYAPGSVMRAREVRVTADGPALGELVSEGVLLNEGGTTLAGFRQRFRAWLGRPVLEIQVEIRPEVRPEGHPWHAYYGARFAWRDVRLSLLRGVGGPSLRTDQTRPLTPDYLELRQGGQSTVILPGGLPFHQRHGRRMVDVLLVPPGETATVFALGLALDRDYPMQTALGMMAPAPILPVTKGPPPTGPVGWLFHLDLPSVALTSLRPIGNEDAVVAQLVECARYGGRPRLRCARFLRAARLVDALGRPVGPAEVDGDVATFELPAGAMAALRMDFSQRACGS